MGGTGGGYRIVKLTRVGGKKSLSAPRGRGYMGL